MHLKLYDHRTAHEAADLALKNHLYVSGWLLSRELQAIRSKLYHSPIALCFVDGAPVALCLISDHGQAMAFCKTAHRRKGYGSACFQLVRGHQKVYAAVGIRESRGFWLKNGVTPRYPHSSEL